MLALLQLSTNQDLNTDVTKQYLFKSSLNIVLNMQKACKEADSKMKWQVSIPADIFSCED